MAISSQLGKLSKVIITAAKLALARFRFSTDWLNQFVSSSRVLSKGQPGITMAEHKEVKKGKITTTTISVRKLTLIRLQSSHKSSFLCHGRPRQPMWKRQHFWIKSRRKRSTCPCLSPPVENSSNRKGMFHQSRLQQHLHRVARTLS